MQNRILNGYNIISNLELIIVKKIANLKFFSHELKFPVHQIMSLASFDWELHYN